MRIAAWCGFCKAYWDDPDRFLKNRLYSERVIAARERQLARFKDHPGIYSNAMMHAALARKICQIDKQGEMLLKIAMKKLDLSARAFDRILKVARTITDLADKPEILPEHLAEAIQYRSRSRIWSPG